YFIDPAPGAHPPHHDAHGIHGPALRPPASTEDSVRALPWRVRLTLLVAPAGDAQAAAFPEQAQGVYPSLPRAVAGRGIVLPGPVAPRDLEACVSVAGVARSTGACVACAERCRRPSPARARPPTEGRLRTRGARTGPCPATGP